MIETTVVFEADDYGLGSIMGIYLQGHHDDETAIAVAWSELDEYEALAPVKHPVRCYVRKVPQSDSTWTRFVFTLSPGRGASPVTLVELAPARRPKCFLCPWESVVSVGWHHLSDEVLARVPKDMEQVPLCREHGTLALGYALGQNGLVNA